MHETQWEVPSYHMEWVCFDRKGGTAASVDKEDDSFESQTKLIWAWTGGIKCKQKTPRGMKNSKLRAWDTRLQQMMLDEWFAEVVDA